MSTTNEWVNAFNSLTTDGHEHLHQIAGWTDITDAQVWHNFVSEVIKNHIKDGDKVFEAGCGVVSFLLSIRQKYPNIEIFGCDGAAETIVKVQNEIVKDTEKDNFFVGLLPEGLKGVPDSTYDNVLMNSVAQYLSEDEVYTTVKEMLRIAKSGSTVIVADVCDLAFKEETDAAMNAHWTGYKGLEKDSQIKYTFFSEDWWKQKFGNDPSVKAVSTSRVGEKGYERRRMRYQAYITKH